MTSQKREAERIAMKVSRNTIIGNFMLSVLKFGCGFFGKSSAMLSDAVHSASDVLSTIVVMIGVKLSNKESDKKHPYGHERLECIAAIILGIILFATGAGIAVSGIQKIWFKGTEIAVPKGTTLWAAGISIAVKEVMYWYTKLAADKIHSDALLADAWHHRSDALSSVGSLIGIAGAKLGYPVCDPITCVIIAGVIVKAAAGIIINSFRKMVDESCDDTLVSSMKNMILEQEGVLGIDEMKTRMFGAKIYVDIDIAADGEISLDQAHKIAEKVHDTVEEQFPDVKHCMVHVSPYLFHTKEKK
ncbi:cation diffusion facilitator family transporter [[Clostridium] polysaccharolyticum]|uniref:Cation diffusion facilitator family transporter n=1 Tax=[Clostridium] polysaccharolyticum TaxID=29364 RepID=A0A1I0DLD6_9FIRM|nr:cation diffusion facilitator family transporter [[Clostridium] polysaccharolyticum]SET32987.1 cation diffusion facilitator family transporter [[Clostridium] polysaccharolyticum]